jgi:uracil-DNA glycosylase family 4
MSQLSELYDVVRGCKLCDLSKGRTLAVPGEGPETARVMFIGEAPGYHEDRQGRPFVGAAGQFLQELLGRAGLRREDVYICNVIKCRPPQNRDPLPEEIEACRPYLDRQIELIQPGVIVTLGRFSMARYFPNQSISRVHGQHKRLGDTWYMPMFHPAAALHQPRYRSMIEEDFQKLATLLAEVERANATQGEDAGGVSAEPPELTATQLSLF